MERSLEPGPAAASKRPASGSHPAAASSAGTEAAGHELFTVADRRAPELQAEVEVSRTDDPQERDADRIAEQALRASASSSPPSPPEATPGPSEGVAPAIVHEVLGSPGAPLEGGMRAFFEPKLASDLSDVRVHRDPRAAASARAVNAAAYTVGADIVFANGRYAPNTRGGRTLLAHELGHVLQRRVAGAGPGPLNSAPAVSRRLARQDVGHVSQEAPSVPAPGLNPWPALEKLDAWRVKASVVADAVATWQMGNWIDYIKRTSLNPRLSLADGQLASIASNAVGNAITFLGEKRIEIVSKVIAGESARLIGAAIGTAIEPGGGTAIGFVIGVVIESAASWAFENITGKSDVDESAADAAMRTGGLIADQLAALAALTQESRAQTEAMVTTIKGTVRDAATQDDVDRIAAWAEREIAQTPEPKAVDDRSMADELLQIWVLEHGASPWSAQDDTSETQWQQAVEHLTPGGAPIESQPKMFAFQTRAEWTKAGLEHAAQSEAMMAEANEQAAAGRSSAGAGATMVQNRFHNKTYELPVKDPEAFARYVIENATYEELGMLGLTAAATTSEHLDDPEWIATRAREGKAQVSCILDVQIRSNSAYIDEWNWDVDLGELPRVPGYESYPAPRWRVAFDVWPTW
jgi:hypothetical protein